MHVITIEWGPMMSVESLREDVRNVRHLLAHFENPRALERNPLVRYLLPQTGAGSGSLSSGELHEVHSAVRAAIENLQISAGKNGHLHATRQYAILTRCDLGGEPMTAVARDLGIGIRKLYYERRAGMARLAEMLRASAAKRTVPKPARPLIDDERIVDELATLGRPDLASEVLHRVIAKSEGDVRNTVVVLPKLIRLLCDYGEVERAKFELENAERLFSTLRPSGHHETNLKADLEYASSLVAWESGQLAESMRYAKRAAKRLKPLTERGDPSTSGLAAKILHWLGIIQGDIGLMPDAIRICQEAARMLVQLPNLPRKQYCEVLISLGIFEAMVPGGMQRSREHNQRALAIATNEGFLPLIVAARVNEAMLHHYCGDHARALAHIQAAVNLENAMCGRWEHMRVTAMHARMLAFSGRPNLAMKTLQGAGIEHVSGNRIPYYVSQIVCAETQNILGDHEHAFESASSSAMSYQRIGINRGFGMAMTEAALAQEGLGNRALAIQCIDQALETLERLQHPYYLSVALACSARLTDNRTRRDAANEFHPSITV